MIQKFNNNFICLDKIDVNQNSRYLTKFKSKLDVVDNSVFVEITTNEILEKINKTSYSKELINFIIEKGYNKHLLKGEYFKLRIKCDCKGIEDLQNILRDLYDNDENIVKENIKIENNNLKTFEEFKLSAKIKYGIKVSKKDFEEQILLQSKPPLEELQKVFQKIIVGVNEKIKEVYELAIKEDKAQYEENKKINLIFEIAKKQGYNKEANLEDIKNFIYENKYLKLAKALNDVRNDWNDGCYLIEHALSHFSIDSILDENIVEEINECIKAFDNGDTDGRVFRDCKYNYNYLYSLVPSEFLEIKEQIEE